MESNVLSELSQKLQIASEFIVREYWEIVILKELSQSLINTAIIFKGGTALRLSYNSPRFSEDLDFDLSEKIIFSKFEKVIYDIDAKYSEITLKDIAKKYYTFIAQFSIREPNLLKNFSIKIEISTRNIRKKDYAEPRILISPVTDIQVLINTAKIESIETEKKQAIKTRKQSRDLFDLWYIAQLQRKIWSAPEHSFSAQDLKRELNKFLPKNYQNIIKELSYEK